MYDLRHCVRDKDNIYCWDNANGAIIKVRVNKVGFDECPDHVLRQIMQCLQQAEPSSVALTEGEANRLIKALNSIRMD